MTAYRYAAVAPLPIPLRDHAAVTLPDGRIFVTAGRTLSNVENKLVFLYDPVLDTWATGAPYNGTYSTFGAPSAVLLPNGKVLLIGENGVNATGSGEVYDPISDGWQNTIGSFTNYYYSVMLFAFANGKVLLFGEAQAPGVSELYDSGTGLFSAGPDMPITNVLGSMLQTVAGFVAVQLHNGDVLVTGGHTTVPFPPATTYAVVYHWVTNTWTVVANGAMQNARENHCMVLLATHHVLIAGGSSGYNGANPTLTADLYNTSTDTITPITPQMRYTKIRSAAFAIPGTAKGVISGGFQTDLAAPGIDVGPTSEIYDESLNEWHVSPPPAWSHISNTYSVNQVWASLLSTGAPVLIGGHDAADTVPSTLSEVLELPIVAPVVIAIALTALDVHAGPTAGGTLVTIFGTGFAENAVVFFGQLRATAVIVHNPTRLTCHTPEHTIGLVDVTVVNP